MNFVEKCFADVDLSYIYKYVYRNDVIALVAVEDAKENEFIKFIDSLGFPRLKIKVSFELRKFLTDNSEKLCEEDYIENYKSRYMTWYLVVLHDIKGSKITTSCYYDEDDSPLKRIMSFDGIYSTILYHSLDDFNIYPIYTAVVGNIRRYLSRRYEKYPDRINKYVGRISEIDYFEYNTLTPKVVLRWFDMFFDALYDIDDYRMISLTFVGEDINNSDASYDNGDSLYLKI